MQMKSVPTIDAHHHIWRLNDLPWLSGPQVPRIFGPYQPMCCDYPIAEYRADTAGCDIVKSIYIQTNWPAGQSFDEARWVQSVADETGWPHANVAYADLADPDVASLLKRLADAGDARHPPATALARKSAISLRAAARRYQGRRLAPRAGPARRLRPAVRAADFCQPDARWCGVGARVPGYGVRARTCRHAGRHVAPRLATLARRHGGAGAMPQCQRQTVRARHLRSCLPGRRDRADRQGNNRFIRCRSLLVRQFPIEKLWTDYATLYRTFREAIAYLGDAEQKAILHDTAAQLYRI